MTRIVRTAYRYKRPPRKRQAVAIEVPAVVKAVEHVRECVAQEQEAEAEADMPPPHVH